MGGGVRTAASGPRWSMLAAAVLVLVGVWGSTRFLAEEPQELLSPVPAIADTVDLANGEDAGAAPQEPTSGLAAISVRTQDAPSQVVIRDASGRILFAGRLGEGQSQRVIGTAPFDVTAGNGQAVRVTYLGEDRGSVGDADTPDNRRFG
jgi:cytoskeleton protein RodZ